MSQPQILPYLVLAVVSFIFTIIVIMNFIFYACCFLFLKTLGNSLAVQWSGHCASTAGGPGLFPDGGTTIPQAAWHGQNKQTRNQKMEHSVTLHSLNLHCFVSHELITTRIHYVFAYLFLLPDRWQPKVKDSVLFPPVP